MRIIKIKNKDNYPYITLNLAFLLYPSILKESITVDWSAIDHYNELPACDWIPHHYVMLPYVS